VQTRACSFFATLWTSGVSKAEPIAKPKAKRLKAARTEGLECVNGKTGPVRRDVIRLSNRGDGEVYTMRRVAPVRGAA